MQFPNNLIGFGKRKKKKKEKEHQHGRLVAIM